MTEQNISNHFIVQTFAHIHCRVKASCQRVNVDTGQQTQRTKVEWQTKFSQ